MTELRKAVFLSYASQDADAALRICETLRAAGIEVWFDQSELRGGDAWDASIRQQIKACSLFMPVISANTRSRVEGYFRLEWKLAVDRSYLMAAERAFLVPLIIDGTNDADALVPDRFREVQWTRMPDGVAPPGFAGRIAGLLASAEHGSAAAAPPALRPAQQSHETPAAAARPARSNSAILAVAVLALLGLGYFALDHFVLSKHGGHPSAASSDATATSTPTPTPQSTISAKSIAVLPFVNMSSDKEQEYFSDGLAEELLDLLAKTPGLHVIARTSSFSFKGKSDDIPTIAAKLKVANILEGSVRKSGARLRVTTELIRADSGERIWSETYDRELKDVFKVQDEIAGAVVAALKLKLAPTQDSGSHGTANTAAYNQYLLGRQAWNRRSLEGYLHAAEFYQKAIALDPSYADAYAGLAMAQEYVADATGDLAGFKQAMEAAEKAVALAPDQASGYAARAYIRTTTNWNWSGAQEDLTRALELDAGDSTVQRRYGQLQGALGHLPEAIAATQKAIALDPLSEPAWQTLEQYYMATGDLTAALDANRHALEINPESGYALNDLGTIQLMQGKPADAIATFSSTSADLFRYTGLAMAHYSAGHPNESQQALDKVIAKLANAAAYQIAEVYLWRKEKDKGFEWLDRALAQQDGGLSIIKFDPLISSVRDDPRYAALLRKINLTP